MSKSHSVASPPSVPIYHWCVDKNLIITSIDSDGFFPSGSTEGAVLSDLINDSHELDIAVNAHNLALLGRVALYEAERLGQTFLVCAEPNPGRQECSVTAVNITPYKQHLESILNAAGEGIYGLDLEGKATFVNPAAIEMTGWSAEETIGHNIHYKHHHSYADGRPYPHTECPIYAAINDGEIHEVNDELFWRKDGSSFPVEYTSTPIYHDGVLSGAVVVFKDITERKAAEHQLLDAFREVEKLKEQLQEYNNYLKEEIREEHNFGQIIGGSSALKSVLRQVNQVASTTATVLITGESGTGKELISRSIHDSSPRRDQALVKINCGAIAEGLVESELFGHEKGAFTHALNARRGRFELADGGSLFLDEVGDLPLSIQVKLLRVLQEQEVVRVGGSESIKVDVRIIAATNRDLPSMIERGQFREDLFYRLNLFPMDMPPLRDRRDDIAPLARHFLVQAARKFGKPLRRIPQADISRLEGYGWPGNIRELQNLIERAVILSDGDSLEVGALIPEGVVGGKHRALTLKEMEIQHIEKALVMMGGIISGPKGAAVLLDIHPNTLRSKMQKLGISGE